MTNLLTRIIATTLLFSTVFSSLAQDAHYWTLQFGSKSALLGGAVIGSVADISATYYNPGSLTLIEDLSFTISADVLEFSRLRLTDDGGRGIDLDTRSTGIRPSLVAGLIKKNVFGKGGVLAYSLVNRQNGHYDIQGLVLLDRDVEIPEIKYNDLALLARFEGAYNDTWAGLTYALPVNHKFGVGVTWYHALASQRRWAEGSLQGVNDDGTGTISVLANTSNFFTYRMIFKLGASYRTEQFTAGLTITAPGLHMFGNGFLGHNESYLDQDSSALAINYQNKLKSNFKSPLSIGLGCSWNFGKFTLHASAEWFDGVSSYVVMQGDDWNVQNPNGDIRSLQAIHEQESILNWGLGIQYAVNSTMNLYSSYYIDKSTRGGEIEQADLSTSSFDINNVSIGTEFRVSGVQFDLGLGYSWGANLHQELSDLIGGQNGDVEVNFEYTSFKLLFGVEIDLKRKEK
jgi:hypothetical protein